MSYSNAIKESLPAFILGRLIPTLGVSAVFLLMAHESPDDLPVFAYVLAVASVISGFFSMILAMVGNKTASLAGSPSAQSAVFTGGLTLAMCLGALVCLVCLLTTYMISHTDGLQQMDRRIYWTLSLIYIASTPLLVINSFLQLFLEAIGKASGYANARTSITVICSGFLAMLFGLASTDDFKYWAMSYFFISELLTLILLIRLSGNQRYLSWINAKENAVYFIRTGVPIAAGMSGQKLYFYLLTERLARLDAHLVAELSVFMTVIGLLIIPSVALAQLHSLQVSREVERSRRYFRAGLGWLGCGSLLISMILGFVGEDMFSFLGGSVINYNAKLMFTAIIFLVSSSLLALAFGHLRALNETLFPQLLINTIMLALLIPTLYTVQFDTPALANFLMLQTAAITVGFLILVIRINVLHRRLNLYSDAAASL